MRLGNNPHALHQLQLTSVDNDLGIGTSKRPLQSRPCRKKHDIKYDCGLYKLCNINSCLLICQEGPCTPWGPQCFSGTTYCQKSRGHHGAGIASETEYLPHLGNPLIIHNSPRSPATYKRVPLRASRCGTERSVPTFHACQD